MSIWLNSVVLSIDLSSQCHSLWRFLICYSEHFISVTYWEKNRIIFLKQYQCLNTINTCNGNSTSRLEAWRYVARETVSWLLYLKVLIATTMHCLLHSLFSRKCYHLMGFFSLFNTYCSWRDIEQRNASLIYSMIRNIIINMKVR